MRWNWIGAAVLWSGVALADPLVVSHGGFLIDGTDQPVTRTARLGFRVYDALAGGQLAWAGLDCAVDVRSGRYSVALGDPGPGGCGTGLTTDTVPPGAARYLEILVDGTPLSPRQRWGAVPTAQVAARALVADTLAASGLAALDDRFGRLQSTPATPQPGSLSVTGQMSAALVHGSSITADAAAVGTVTAQSAAVSGDVVAGGRFVGNGSGLTGLSITTAAPLTGQGSAASPLSIAAASPSTAGYLTTADYTSFASKLDSLSVGSGLVLGGTATRPVISLAPGAGATPSYSSGVITVAAGASVTLTHGLGSSDLASTLWQTTDGGSTFEQVTPVSTGGNAAGTYGSGADGVLQVTTSGVVVNTVRARASATAGASTVSISGGTGTFTAGDAVFLIQMQGSTAGLSEEGRVTGVSGATLTLSGPVVNTYVTSGAATAQIIRVPQYSSVVVGDGASITAPAWDGQTGGIVAFKVLGALSLQGTAKIDASARGFRGGVSGCSPGDCATQPLPFSGESPTGPGSGSTSANGGGGSAGLAGNNEGMTGGFGASYATSGTVGTTACTNCGLIGNIGLAYGDAPLTKLYLGSGGGGGSNWYYAGYTTQNIATAATYSTGGAGGGLIRVWAQTLSVSGSGSFVADGGSGLPGYLRANTASDISSGGGGGGSGGTIYLTTQSPAGTLLARGGSGGSAPATGYGGWSVAPAGGNGGSGRVRIDSASTGTAVSTPAAYPGTTPAFTSGIGLSLSDTNSAVVRNTTGGSVQLKVVLKK